MHDLTNHRFGRLVAVAQSTRQTSSREYYWRCRCDCGQFMETIRGNLLKGNTRSCGCLRAESSAARARKHRTHGHSNLTREYVCWQAMKSRCSNPKNASWKYYGAKGVTVCPEWVNDFARFLSDMGPRPVNQSLDRIDPNGNYERGNCRWADNKTQRGNRRVA